MNICDQTGYDPRAINSCDGNRNAAPGLRVQNTGQNTASDVPRIVVIGCSGHARVVVDILIVYTIFLATSDTNFLEFIVS